MGKGTKLCAEAVLVPALALVACADSGNDIPDPDPTATLESGTPEGDPLPPRGTLFPTEPEGSEETEPPAPTAPPPEPTEPPAPEPVPPEETGS